MSAPVEPFRIYASQIASMLTPPPVFTSESEGASAVQVERGVIYAQTLLGQNPAAQTVEPLIDLTRGQGLERIAVVDRSGHHRPVYRGLLIYSWLQTFRLVYETLPRSEFGRWDEALRAWCDLLESELGQIEIPRDVIPAARGASATEAAWTALCLFVAGKLYVRDAWLDLASDTFGKISRAQTPHGALLTTTPADNPDSHAYHELVLLHALASYAVGAEDRTIAASVARATEFHLQHTQPEHATWKPWAVFAFIWDEQSRPLADTILHAAKIQQLDSNDGISLMLLADALYCLRLFPI